MNLEKVLSGNAGWEGIRRLVVSPPARKLLRRELGVLSQVPQVLGPCHLQHVRFRIKPNPRLSAYFRVGMRGQSLNGDEPRTFAVIWKPKWVGDLSATEPEPEPEPEVILMEEEAERRGVAMPFHRLARRVPAWGMQIQVSPLDTAFPQLVRMSDPDYVSGVIATTAASSHPAAHFLPEGRYQVKAIRYLPGQRHVLRYDPLDPARGPTVFAKLYKPADAAGARRIFEAANSAAEILRASQKGIAGLRPLGYSTQDAAVFHPGLSGRPLDLQLRRCGQEVGRALELAGRAIRVFHDSTPSSNGSLELHSFEAEIAEVVRACGHIGVLLPSVGAIVDALLDRAGELHDHLPQEPPVLTHGDAKVEHFWITPPGLTLMDFDRFRLGDPALDLGKFLADLRWWFAADGQSTFEEAREQFLTGYAVKVPQHRLIRARLYEALELVKVTGFRVLLSDPNWGTRVTRLVSSAISLLESLHEFSGSKVNGSRLIN
ncbi:MAG TPA: aminoglycoside phosphotransferase family protein [Candidatus Bathyarchaeia archaeon]|nr:aminoglycoside phosphotransferase family protein [Candidatus Bathyarchaeia archaeon]